MSPDLRRIPGGFHQFQRTATIPSLRRRSRISRDLFFGHPADVDEARNGGHAVDVSQQEPGSVVDGRGGDLGLRLEELRHDPGRGADASATSMMFLPRLSSRMETRFERAGPVGVAAATATATGAPAVPAIGRRPVAASTALKPPTLPRRSRSRGGFETGLAAGGFELPCLPAGRFESACLTCVTSMATRPFELARRAPLHAVDSTGRRRLSVRTWIAHDVRATALARDGLLGRCRRRHVADHGLLEGARDARDEPAIAGRRRTDRHRLDVRVRVDARTERGATFPSADLAEAGLGGRPFFARRLHRLWSSERSCRLSGSRGHAGRQPPIPRRLM